MQTASLLDIPHVHLGTCEGSVPTNTYICFPQLFRKGGTSTLLASDREQLYDKCILPALQTVVPNSIEMTKNRTRVGQRLPGTWGLIKHASDLARLKLADYAVSMQPGEHREFLGCLRNSLAQDMLFNDWFLVHVIETPCDPHSPTSDVEVNSAWEQVMKLIHVRQRERNDWKVFVGLRVHSEGNVALVKSSRRQDVLARILPDVSPEDLRHELDRKHSIIPCYNYDGASTFQVSTRHLEGNQHVEHVYVHSRYSSPPEWPLFSPADLFPSRIEKTQEGLVAQLSKIREQIAPTPAAREVWTSITILTSYAEGTKAGKLDMNGLVEVIDGQVWWYARSQKLPNS